MGIVQDLIRSHFSKEIAKEARDLVEKASLEAGKADYPNELRFLIDLHIFLASKFPYWPAITPEQAHAFQTQGYLLDAFKGGFVLGRNSLVRDIPVWCRNADGSLQMVNRIMGNVYLLNREAAARNQDEFQRIEDSPASSTNPPIKVSLEDITVLDTTRCPRFAGLLVEPDQYIIHRTRSEEKILDYERMNAGALS